MPFVQSIKKSSRKPGIHLGKKVKLSRATIAFFVSLDANFANYACVKRIGFQISFDNEKTWQHWASINGPFGRDKYGNSPSLTTLNQFGCGQCRFIDSQYVLARHQKAEGHSGISGSNFDNAVIQPFMEITSPVIAGLKVEER